MEKEQSAVTWLVEEFDKIEKDWEKDSIEYSDLRSRALELAEYMFKEQIIDACDYGKQYHEKFDYTAEQYYNETFKSAQDD